MRVGLVLGAGGLVGIAWLVGGLRALEEETGWDPGDADCILGTSAGSIVGSLVAEGEHRLAPALSGLRDPKAAATYDGSTIADPEWPPADMRELAGRRLHRGVPSFGVGSWRLALSALTHPAHHTPLTVYSSLLPKGMISTEPVKELIRRRVPFGWSSHPNLWIVACDYTTGRRVAFGRADAPVADLAQAVAASCAIPGTYHPETIQGRRYVDGGMYSTSNLSLLRDFELDLVICLNPTSSLHPPQHMWNPLDAVAGLVRRESGRRLGRETRRLRERGTEVVLVQPTSEDLSAMGQNLMSTNRRRHETVTQLARRTVAEQLRAPEAREVLDQLP